MRVAWHSSGTFDKSDGSGGANGATMRFEPEASDGANAGLHIVHDLLHPVKSKFPTVSFSDIWAAAGCVAVESLGGPEVPFNLGRQDTPEGGPVPPNGRLPDAAQGAQHLRDVFYRMGFDDRDIVALSGGHTLGRCHKSRSGYDGPWTANILKFDNSYYKNLMELEWTKREWDGPEQFADPSGRYMMLPTDMALRTDPAFAPIAAEYAADQEKFFKDFSSAYARLMALGCPAEAQPDLPPADGEEAAAPELPAVPPSAEQEFREHCMHGSLERSREVVARGGCDVHALEANSGRTALHKAVFWGHVHMMDMLLDELKMDTNAADYAGDTPLHDAARFGHEALGKRLKAAGADNSVKNKDGQTAAEVAIAYGKCPRDF